MNKKKIFNDPVYGFVTIPYEIIFDLIEHPYFQRLRRIKQIGMGDYVYPGALHTRFHHAIGALHLMGQAIEVLRTKEVEITEEEAQAASIAILLHDIGHGPFSHALENTIIEAHHEQLSLLFMEQLNAQFAGALTLAIHIFKNEYPKPFLHQLVSSQLDMDRMDYLNRDSFFTGVSEGVIGYDRIIKMLAVRDGQLVVEEKGIYSVEKFLIARRLMYWQVYLHKTAVVAEQMLIKTLQRAKELALSGVKLNVPDALAFFLYQEWKEKDFEQNHKKLVEHFALLDDYDIVSSLKYFMNNQDYTLAYLSNALINRKLFKITFQNIPFERDYVQKMRQNVQNILSKEHQMSIDYFIFEGKESNSTYNPLHDEIHILLKDGSIQPMSAISDHNILPKTATKYFMCYPKNIF